MTKKIKYIIIIGITVCSFLFGLSTGHYKHFPFSLLVKIKSTITQENSKSYRNISTDGYSEIKPIVTDNTGIFLTYGQSNSVNHGQIGYDVKNSVLMFFENKTYKYKDPSLGGTGYDGSVWGMVGDKLVDNGIYDQVVFSNCGWGGKSIKELKEGHLYDYLVENYNQLKEKFGRVDGILFHQGESDNNESGHDYYYDSFVEFLNNLKSEGIDTKIYLSRVSYCHPSRPTNNKLISVQNKIIEDFSNVYEGPNTDLITERKYRLPDDCHFSIEGYRRFSDMWIESLTK